MLTKFVYKLYATYRHPKFILVSCSGSSVIAVKVVMLDLSHSLNRKKEMTLISVMFPY